MADKPIIFSAPMVVALLEGRKTQTRRILKASSSVRSERVRFAVSDRLWMRENLRVDEFSREWFYGADNSSITLPFDDQRISAMIAWASLQKRDYCPSIHMPRWASRLTLTVTDIRVQRLQEISGPDEIAEGVQCETCAAMSKSQCNLRGCFASSALYRDLWNTLHGPGAWGANPWVCALTFTVKKGNIDEQNRHS